MNNPHAHALHASPFAGVFFVTGGGITLLADLLTEPGASSSVLEASVPYAEAALTECLGGTPDQACSADTARALAMAAWARARQLQANTQSTSSEVNLNCLFGLGCTAALATNRPKRGKHRAYVAVQTLTTTATALIEFDKGEDGLGNRAIEEAQLTQTAWQLLDSVLDVRLNAESVPTSTKVTTQRTEALQPWIRLMSGASNAQSNVHSNVHSNVQEKRPDTPRPRALLSGSFNPLHQGHVEMADFASSLLGQDVHFELCIDNVDKPALSYSELEIRCRQFESRQLWLTRLPTFIEKAREFPNCTFVLGIDTLVRIGMPRYYQSPAAMHAAFDEFASLGTRFLVFGRDTPNDDEGFVTLSGSNVPESLRALCDEVSEKDFRIDLSSSQLRSR